MSKKVIITGVSGQDGSYMVDYLIKNTDYQIFGVVRRCAKPDYSNIKQWFGNSRFKIVVGDLSDSQSIDNLVREIMPDYFINFAAQSFVGSSWQIPEQTFDAGAMGVLRCLEAIRKHAPQCRFYNAGSSEEFGDTITVPQNESHPLRPQSPYGAAKAAARHIVRVYRESYNIYAIQGILFNHESPRRGEEFVTRKITKGIARIKFALENNQPFDPIQLGNLDAKRDWSHARDFIKGIWMMLNQELYRRDLQPELYQEGRNHSDLSRNLKEYVLSSNETHTVREFVELACSEAGLDVYWIGSGISEQLVLKSLSPHIPDRIIVNVNPKFYRPAEVNLLHGDSNAARKELGWNPDVSFISLVKEMVESDCEQHGKQSN